LKTVTRQAGSIPSRVTFHGFADSPVALFHHPLRALIARLDPTGNGGIVAGFGDLREVELLVEAGFTPLEAIKIASFNGAKFLGEDARIGSIAVGKQADLLVVRGNPSLNISEIEKVEIVFKDGVGYDSEKLDPIGAGLVGIR
jgi:Amidohydrolase family